MIPETRPLSVRIKVLADQASARAIGARKIAARSLQDAENADREAGWLNEAVVVIKGAGK